MHPSSGQWFALAPDEGYIQGSVGTKRHAQERAAEWLEVNWEY